ncbi:GntR family transcriptional regulator [Azorhizobium oxalatiphilum]|uniref:GntR family transcriptional regulator n=1 Tax=Azorhizobium oxalatiphilum TaxID=980631 RepID=A0A917BLI9_9HYPH|nr:GntR family transcriptional regulator [Azorhizobium oxalatiphilum]GGF48326.1 GntR family transcriptional regulator [Azorhizobium oxalatiphilum]
MADITLDPLEPPRSGTATRSLSVTDRIRAAVLSGDLEPGARLHEVRLSETLGVSRTPVRSALQSLASEGLLEYAPNRGYSVRRFRTSEIVDAYEIRAMLESLAARFAAERGLSDEERATIERALEEGDQILAKEELGEEERIAYGAVNFVFHDTIHNAARCRMLGDMVRLCQSVPQSSHRNVVSFDHMDVRRRHDDHHRIYDAILLCDAYRAEMLMREHVASVKTSLVRALSGRPSPLPRRGR